MAPYFDQGSTPHRAPSTRSRLFASKLFILTLTMGDQEKMCGDLLGVKVQETALEFGGPAWVFENVHEGDGGHIIEGKIIDWAQGRTKGRDRYCVQWETGHNEKLKLDQVRRPLPANEGTVITALPSSVRLLTAASCCSWNHLPARGGQCGGGS